MKEKEIPMWVREAGRHLLELAKEGWTISLTTKRPWAKKGQIVISFTAHDVYVKQPMHFYFEEHSTEHLKKVIQSYTSRLVRDLK